MPYAGRNTLPLRDALACNAWYPLGEFKLQSQAALPLLCSLIGCQLPCDCGMLIMYASCVQALHCGDMP